MNTVTLAEIYKTTINWPRWFKIVNVLGDQCNAMKNRFDKADILEQAIESCSNGRLKWVDLVGRDHHDEELNLDIEFKYAINSMFTETKQCIKAKSIVSMKIKNSLGGSKTDIESPADYYMFAQQNAVGIISYEEMKPYLKPVSDGISTAIPHDKITYIITPSECKEVNTGDCSCNYLEKKRRMQLEFINSIQ